MTPSHYAIEIESLRKIYPQKGRESVTAVADLNLKVPRGQIFGFLGANGAGKTTTIKMACGLVRATAGRVLLNGFDVEEDRNRAMAQVGAVLEGTRNIYWRLSAWQNLLYFGRLKGVAGDELKGRAEYLLRDLDLWPRRDDPVRGFSRGMQQKVAIACALVSDPPIVLLDEPTLGLDVQSARVVRSWIRRLVKEEGKSVVLTTHQMEMAESLCDRVAIMSRGRLLADRPTRELLELFSHEGYRIRVAGHLQPDDLVDYPAFTLSREEDEMEIQGTLSDRGELYGLIARLQALGTELISVSPIDPNLESIFVELTTQDEDGVNVGADGSDLSRSELEGRS